jgi:hypothetical protein
MMTVGELSEPTETHMLVLFVVGGTNGRVNTFVNFTEIRLPHGVEDQCNGLELLLPDLWMNETLQYVG